MGFGWFKALSYLGQFYWNNNLEKLSGNISFYYYEASDLRKNTLKSITEFISNKNRNIPSKFCSQI